MSAPYEVRQHWIRLLSYLRSDQGVSNWAAFPIASLQVVDDWIDGHRPVEPLWEPVPLGVMLAAQGELYCMSDMINSNKVWLFARGAECKTRVLLPDNVRLFHTGFLEDRR